MGGEIPGRLAARHESSGGEDRVQSCPTCHHISQQLLLLADFPPGYSPQLAFMQLQDATVNNTHVEDARICELRAASPELGVMPSLVFGVQ